VRANLPAYDVFTVFEQPFVPRGRDMHTAPLRRKRGKPCSLAEVPPHAASARSRACCVSDVDPRAPFARGDDGATTDANRRGCQKEQRLQHRYAIALQCYATRREAAPWSRRFFLLLAETFAGF